MSYFSKKLLNFELFLDTWSARLNPNLVSWDSESVSRVPNTRTVLLPWHFNKPNVKTKSTGKDTALIIAVVREKAVIRIRTVERKITKSLT